MKMGPPWRSRRSSVWDRGVLILLILTRLTCTWTQTVSETPPTQFREQPSGGQPMTEGMLKRLSCEAFAYPSPVYSWQRDGSFLAVNSTRTYEIRNIQRSDVGEYRCLASNKHGGLLSQGAEVQVAYLVSLPAEGPQSVVVDNGQPVILPLPAIDSFPSPAVDWYRNNTHPVASEDVFYSITLNKSLALLSLQSSDNGQVYHAQATNGFTSQQTNTRKFQLSVAAINPSGTIAPSFVIRPQNTRAVIKPQSQAAFECIVNARPMTYLTIRWFRVVNGSRGSQISSSSKYQLSYFRRQLVIKTLVLGDAGEYECEATHNVPGNPGTPITARATLTLTESPQVVPGPSIVERDYSQTVLLQCQTLGSPAPSISWYFNGRPLSLVQTSRHSVSQNGSLTITNVDLPDAGVYQCFARNDAGEAFTATWFKVNSAPPRFERGPENMTVVEGEETRFPCEVSGAPKPNITWYRVSGSNETQIVSQGRFQVLERELLITNALKDDSGQYRCFARNIKGDASAQAQLRVIIKTQITRPPQDSRPILSTSARLSCGVTHDSSVVPTWHWYFYKQPDFSQQRITSNGRYTISSDGSLTISGVAGEDIGRYECVVVSAGGNDSRDATLVVIELPAAPVITSVNLEASQNNSVRINWSPVFDGNTPILRYSISYRQEDPNGNNNNGVWQVYPAPVPPSATSFVIGSLKPARYYRFRISAVNEVGEGETSSPKPDPPIQMPPQPPSLPPKNFYCSPRVDRAIFTQWQIPEEDSWNGELLGFVIRYKLANYPSLSEQERLVNNSQATSYLLDNLVFHKQYEVRIAAFNTQGTGAFSSVFRVWTYEGRPSAPPRNFTLTAISSTTVRARWLPPLDNLVNGVIQGYTIALRRAAVVQTERTVYVPADTDNMVGEQTFDILDLMKFVEYVMNITCKTSAGEGPYSSAVRVTTQEDYPSVVGDLRFDNIRDTNLRVSWSQPQDVNGVLQSYTLNVQQKNGTARVPINLPPTETSYTITGLSPSTTYTISVFASTRKGAGPATSADIKSGVPPELPQPPHNLGITNKLARSVLLQFLPGFDGKTSITQWIVEGLEGSSTTWRTIFTKSDPDAREILVENLRPYTSYRLRIIAENIVGRSNASQPTREFQTKQAAPDMAPGNVTVRALNATALRVSWTPLPRLEWNGAPRGYKIFYRMAPTEPAASLAGGRRRRRRRQAVATSWQVVELDNGINLDSYILARLQEWMSYQVKMCAYTDVGAGVNSSVTTERTQESVSSGSPESVRAVAESSTIINVTWAPVPILEQNGQILGYKVRYGSVEAGLSAQFKTVMGNETLHTQLTGLRKFVQYEVQVLAFTRMGDGVLSQPIVVKTKDDLPGPPVIIYFPTVTYSTAEVVWNPPDEPNGIIEGYEVSYRRRDSNTTTPPRFPVNANTFSKVVDGLERETYYIFSVRAQTKMGWGVPANVLVYTMMDRQRPDSPTKPTIGSSQVQARSVLITWTPGNDNYGPLRNYTVQYKHCNGSGTWTRSTDYIAPDKTSHNVTRLRPNTCYQFRVAATNDIGTSDFSLASNGVQTLTDKPEGPPRNVQVVALTRTSINVSWEVPREDLWNGQIVGYKVQYKQANQEDFQESPVSFRERHKVLYNLVIGIYYDVRLIAYNNQGDGPPSTPQQIFVGEAAPTAAPLRPVMEALSSSSIRISWQAPPPETQNGGLSGYKVTYWTGSVASQPVIVVETSLTLEDLQTFTTYQATVQAYNIAGEGPKTEVLSARTQEGIPGKPKSLTFANISLTELVVLWEAPTVPNGLIIQYNLTYFLKKPNHAEIKQVQLMLNGSQHWIKVKELEEYSNYTFRLGARTSRGRGPEIEANVTTGPQEGSPGRTSPPEVERLQRAFQISWRNGDEGQSPICCYIIQARAADELAWRTKLEKETPEPQASISFHDLKANTQYQFAIISRNQNGISFRSQASAQVETPGPAIAAVAKPFHSEWWFLVIIALTGVIVILVIITLLCLVGRRNKAKDAMKRATTSTSIVTDANQEPEDGGFNSLEMRQSRRSLGLPNGHAKHNTYARTPPRPSPASVTYSDDDMQAKGGMDDNSSSLTEKPSDLDDSTEPSDDESDDDVKVPASPPPPAFSHYATNDQIHQSWRLQHQNPYNAYAYTDSEADSSHYAAGGGGAGAVGGGGVSNNRLVLNNTAGSRSPLAGFSSFV